MMCGLTASYFAGIKSYRLVTEARICEQLFYHVKQNGCE